MTETEQMLKKQVDMLTQTISSLLDVQQATQDKLQQVSNTNYELMRRSEIMRRIVDNMPYELHDGRNRFEYVYPKFETIEQTIQKIVDEKMSLARFGDAEFSIMRNIDRHAYQRIDEKLASRLDEVFHSNKQGLILGVADNFGSLSRFTDEFAHGIRMYMSVETRAYLDRLLDKERVYADGYITRFYSPYRDNHTEAPSCRLKQLKSMWENRDVVIVEGAQTRLGVGNDLFAGTKSVHRILAPATSSFDRYDEILESSKQHAETDTLFLVALGPSAAVLVYDLLEIGAQALDVGHVDLEYEWMKAGEGKRVPVYGKYNNEVEGGDQVADINDPEYEKQVIARFC